MRNISQSTCTVIPPHMQRHLAEHGDNNQRRRVKSTISHTEQLAYGRATSTFMRAPAGRVPHKNRQVYDAGHHHILPGRLVMTEKHPVSADIAAREAFAGAGATHDFFAKVFGRNSIDNRGMRLDSTVHYGNGFDNAMWDGRQMVYGDGDGVLFNRFTSCFDITGHEQTHGITQYTARLEYQGQSGALNEHISDTFGIMVKQFRYAITSRRSDWYIGRGLLGEGVRGVALRSMRAPGTAYDDPVLGKDPQPSHMKFYVDGADDNGGVHINSGIPNHVFYLTATALPGFAWQVAGRVWYEVLMTMLSPAAQFQDFANATVVAAGKLFTVGGNIQFVIAEAWSSVGINVPRSLTRKAAPAARSIVNRQPSTIQPPRDARQNEEFSPMSTGQQHYNEQNVLSFEAINAHVNSFNLAEVTAPAAATPAVEDHAQRLMTSYAAARPILVAVASIPLIPATWRAIITTLVIALDGVTASFKAGKDLAAGGGSTTPAMEPKLPA